MSEPDPTVTVELSADEAVVLLEYLYRTDESGDYSPIHKGEVVALWRLEGALEVLTGAQFKPNYRDLVEAARGRLVGPEDEPSSDDSGSMPE